MTIDAHPELPEFDYIHPSTLLEASQFLAQHAGEARPLLGGTDIFVRMRDGLWHDKYLVDIKKLDGVDRLSFNPDSGLTIGAAVNMNRVIAAPDVQQHYPVLVQACSSVASYQLRTRATIVGNICNASPAGDTIGACLVSDGILTIHGINGFRNLPVKDFFLGPGKTVLQPGEIVLTITFPLPRQGSVGTYIKLGRNTYSDLAIVGITVLGFPDQQSVSGHRFQIALASVAPTPLLATEAQDYLANTPVSPEAFSKAARLAAETCRPIDDVRGGARYRKAMVRRLTEKALNSVWMRLNQ